MPANAALVLEYEAYVAAQNTAPPLGLVKSKSISSSMQRLLFVATAVAEDLAAMNTATFFLERRERANYAAIDKIMKRKGGERTKPEIRCHEPARDSCEESKIRYHRSKECASVPRGS